MGYPKYIILSYKPTRNDMYHMQSLEKDFYFDALGSFDHDFTLNWIPHYMNWINLLKIVQITWNWNT
jgi:hypothetical protein